MGESPEALHLSINKGLGVLIVFTQNLVMRSKVNLAILRCSHLWNLFTDSSGSGLAGHEFCEF